MKALLINLARLGDLVQTSPTCLGLKKQHNAEVHMLVEGSLADFAKGIDGVDKIIAFEEKTLCDGLLNQSKSIVHSYKNWKNLIATLQDENYDLVVNLTHDKVSSRITALSGAKSINGRFEYPNDAAFVNNAWMQYFFAALTNRNVNAFNLCDIYKMGSGSDVPINRVSCKYDIKLEESVQQLLPPRRKGHVIIHPGAARISKQWLPERFAEVADSLTRDGYSVLLSGSPAEKNLADEIKSLCRENVEVLAGKTSLSVLPAVLSQAELLITNDTGPLHLAAAAGTKTVAIFLAYVRPEDTAPYGDGHIIVETNHALHPTQESDFNQIDGFADTVPVEAVLESARSILEKRSLSSAVLDTKSGQYRIVSTIKDSDGLQGLETLFTTKPEDKRPKKTEIMRNFWKKVLLNKSNSETKEFDWSNEEMLQVNTFTELLRKWSVIVDRINFSQNTSSELLAIESQFQSLEAVKTDLTGMFIVQRLARESLYHAGSSILLDQGKLSAEKWLEALKILKMKSLDKLEVA